MKLYNKCAIYCRFNQLSTDIYFFIEIGSVRVSQERKCFLETQNTCESMGISEKVTIKHHENIMLYNFDPLKPHFYIIKLGVTGVYIIFFLFLFTKIDCGHSLEPPRRGGSNEYPQSMCFDQKYEKYQSFLCENFQFLEVKFPICLTRRVFVMFGTRVDPSVCPPYPDFVSMYYLM